MKADKTIITRLHRNIKQTKRKQDSGPLFPRKQDPVWLSITQYPNIITKDSFRPQI